MRKIYLSLSLIKRLKIIDNEIHTDMIKFNDEIFTKSD